MTMSELSTLCFVDACPECGDPDCMCHCHDTDIEYTDDLEPREPRCGHAWDSHSSHGCEVRGCGCEVECR